MRRIILHAANAARNSYACFSVPLCYWVGLGRWRFSTSLSPVRDCSFRGATSRPLQSHSEARKIHGGGPAASPPNPRPQDPSICASARARRALGQAAASRHAARRSRTRMTVMADQGLPVGVATFRSFRMRAISRADLPASSSNSGASAFARSTAAALASRP